MAIPKYWNNSNILIIKITDIEFATVESYKKNSIAGMGFGFGACKWVQFHNGPILNNIFRAPSRS